MATKLLRGDLLNVLSGFITQGDVEMLEGDIELSEQVLLGTAFKQLGDDLLAQARKSAMVRYGGTRGQHLEGRVMFQYKGGGESEVIDTKLVREFYSPESHSGLYKTKQTKETIMFTITEPTE